MSSPALDLDSGTDDLDGELITQEDLATAVGEEMASDDPLMRALWDDLLRGEHAKAVLAEAEMRRVIAFNQSVDHRFQDGMGQLLARIPLSVYLHWAAVHGHEFWDQPDSLDFLAKRAGDGRGNPGLLIKTQGRATIIKDEHFPAAVMNGRPPVRGENSAAGSAPAASAPFAKATEARAPAHSARSRAERQAANIPRGSATPALNIPRARRGRWAR